MKELKECVKQLREIINQNGYETYRKAMLVMEFGIEEEIEENIDKIDRVYDEYISNDYFCNIVDGYFNDLFYQEEEDLID